MRQIADAHTCIVYDESDSIQTHIHKYIQKYIYKGYDESNKSISRYVHT